MFGVLEDLKYLWRARENLVATWPKSYYRREFVRIRCLWGWMYLVNSPALVQYVMVTNDKNYRKSRVNGQTLRLLLGNGVFVSEGPFWQRQRHLQSPATHGSRLPAYAKAIVECGNEMLDQWRTLPPGAVVDVTEPFTLLTGEIISRLMFGQRLGAKGRILYEALKEYQASHGRVHLYELLGLPPWLPRPGRFRGWRAVQRFDGAIYEIIAEGRRRTPAVPPTLLDMLLAFRDDQGRPMPAKMIRDELATMFLAGHETTALALSWAFWSLSCHPEAEARVHEEVDRVLGGRAPTFEDAARLPYVRAVVDETLRLYPPVHAFSREALGDDEIAGHRIRKGSYVTISSWLLHRHELYWENPKLFQPERFLPPRAQNIPQFAYIPFGAGSRTCMGKNLGILETVLLLAQISQSFRLRPPAGVAVAPLGRMTLHPDIGVPMRLEPRATGCRN